jgi:hypothetical protein
VGKDRPTTEQLDGRRCHATGCLAVYIGMRAGKAFPLPYSGGERLVDYSRRYRLGPAHTVTCPKPTTGAAKRERQKLRGMGGQTGRGGGSKGEKGVANAAPKNKKGLHNKSIAYRRRTPQVEAAHAFLSR